MAAVEPTSYDEEDVKALLEKDDTSDGPGFKDESELPESDFVSFAEEDVERLTDSKEGL